LSKTISTMGSTAPKLNTFGITHLQITANIKLLRN